MRWQPEDEPAALKKGTIRLGRSNMPLNWTGTQPLGLQELEAADRYTVKASDSLIRDDGIRCCVRNCHRWLAKRRRGPSDPNAFCPDHGVSVSASPTYVYKDYRHNFMIDVPTLERVKGLKVESWRLGNERSEDAKPLMRYFENKTNKLAKAFGALNLGSIRENKP